MSVDPDHTSFTLTRSRPNNPLHTQHNLTTSRPNLLDLNEDPVGKPTSLQGNCMKEKKGTEKELDRIFKLLGVSTPQPEHYNFVLDTTFRVTTDLCVYT